MENIITTSQKLSSFKDDYAWGRWRFLFEPHAGIIFLLLWAVYAVITFIQQEFIFTDEVYYNSLGEQMAYERIETLLEFRKKWAWVSYLFIPVTILLKAFFVTVCLNVGALLSERNTVRAGFKSLFGLSLKASAVYVLYPLALLLIMLAFSQVEFIEDFQRLDYFSLAGLLGFTDVSEWWIVPLRTIHLFEIVFWIVLAGGLSVLLQQSFRRSLGFVATTYGVGLVLWMLFIMFLYLNFMA